MLKSIEAYHLIDDGFSISSICLKKLLNHRKRFPHFKAATATIKKYDISAPWGMVAWAFDWDGYVFSLRIVEVEWTDSR